MVKHLLPVVLLYAALLSSAQASIVIKKTDVDLGFIYRDEPQTLIFEFGNTSQDTLHIVDIQPSCDCTTAQILPESVAPGATGKVLVFFDPMGYEDRGHFEEFVRIMTTDMQSPELMLTFTAEVGIGPEAEPRSLKFGKVCRGESDTLSLAVRPAPGRSVDVIDVYSDTVCVLVEPLGSDQTGSHEFRVIARNEEACGRFAGFVTVVTSDTLRDKIRVPLTVSLVGKIIADPDVIAFGATLPGTYVAQVVKIYSKEGLKFDVPALSCTIEELEPVVTRINKQTCELRLKVKDGSEPGRVTGEVILETDCPGEPPIEIKVTGYIRSSK